MKKKTRHDCPLVGSCRPIYHPPSLEKANRAFDRWVRAVRWEVWTRRVARVLASAGVPFAVLALLCALAGPCGWLPGEVALLSGGTSYVKFTEISIQPPASRFACQKPFLFL